MEDSEKIAFLERRFAREKKARQEAEKLLEDKSRELYFANQELKQLTEKLEDSVRERTAQLQETLAYLKAIIDNMVDGMIVMDSAGIINRVNPAANSMFDLRESSILGQHIGSLDPELAAIIQKAKLDPKDAFSTEIELKDSRIGKAVSTSILNSDADDRDAEENLGFVTLVRDITQEKEIDRMKTDFISNVSHELRTPLTSVLGFAKIIKKKLEDAVFPVLPPDEKKAAKASNQIQSNIEIIVSEGERLTALINDVLDIAKMESGRLDWKMEELDIREVIERAIASTSSLFSQKPTVRLKKDIPASLPIISGDRYRLIQVVINLLSNAVKFTDKGEILCKLEKLDDRIRVSVRDTGMGIKPADQETVFEKFKQVGDTLTDKPIGTGLGLPISRQIVEYHGGRMWVESEMGQGSTFFFDVPVLEHSLSHDSDKIRKINLEALMDQLTAHPEAHNHPTKTILVVDDEKSIQELLKQELEQQGYEVETASDGIEAIRKVKSERPDLVVLDVMMPNMNGFEVAAIMKNDPVTLTIPIIMHTILEDPERGYKLGIDRYITKSVNTDILLQEVALLLKDGKSPRKVMVINEKESTAKLITEVLRQKGFDVIEALDGPSGIETAKKQKPDLIILDAILSEKSEMVTTLRFEKGLENVFFILLG